MFQPLAQQHPHRLAYAQAATTSTLSIVHTLTWLGAMATPKLRLS